MIAKEAIEIRREAREDGNVEVHASLTFHHAICIPANADGPVQNEKAKEGLIDYIRGEAEE